MSGRNPFAVAVRRLRLEADRVGARLRESRLERRNADRVYRPLFVTGAIGSGTSLLAASLSQRLQVAGAALESAREVSPDSCLFVERVDSFASVREYAESLGPRSDWSLEQAREDLQRLYRRKAVDADATTIVDKAPNANLARVAFLARAFPESPFLLIFRDPVANVEGFRRKWRTFGRDSLDESVRLWCELHEYFLEQAAGFPERVVTVEYEAFVADYEGGLARLSRWLGVPFADEARRVAARAEGKGRGLRGVRDGRIRVVRDANARSYDSLDDDEIARIREGTALVHERLRDAARKAGVAPADAGEPEGQGGV